jgi:transposase-like protein
MGSEPLDQQQVAEQLLAEARAQGVELVGPNGLLNQLTKRVLETALEEEMSAHLGYDKHAPEGRNRGNSRNGVRSKTVLTEIGPVEIDVPRDIDASFEPQIVKKRQRRLTGVDEIVLSLTARGLTTGEISAHFAEVYGASISKDTISKITDKVVEEMTDWCNRPLDQVYPVIFIDAIVVKVRDGQVRNKPIYVVVGVTVGGERDILGLWAGNGGEGAKFWLQVLTELKNRGVQDVCIAVCDGLKHLPDAITAVWEQTVVQQCIIHLLRNTFRYASRKYWDQIAHDLRPVYTAATEGEALARFEEFEEKWGKPYPAISRLWRSAWSEFVPFLDYGACRRMACRPAVRTARPEMMSRGQVVSSRGPGTADVVAGGHAGVAPAGSSGVVRSGDGRSARHFCVGADPAPRWSRRRRLRPGDAVRAAGLRLLPRGAIVAADRAIVRHRRGVPGVVRPGRSRPRDDRPIPC